MAFLVRSIAAFKIQKSIAAVRNVAGSVCSCDILVLLVLYANQVQLFYYELHIADPAYILPGVVFVWYSLIVPPWQLGSSAIVLMHKMLAVTLTLSNW